MRKKVWAIALSLMLVFFVSYSFADDDSDSDGLLRKSIKNLQQQIDELEKRVYDLEGAPAVPQEYSVNCSGGEKIADVLAQIAYTNGPVIITISGLCQESLTITRDNITLRGTSTGDGLKRDRVEPEPIAWDISNIFGVCIFMGAAAPSVLITLNAH